MNPDGTDLRQLTFNEVEEQTPILSPNGKKIAFASRGVQTSNPQGDYEVYVMNALDGSAKKNLSNNGLGVEDYAPAFSPDGRKIAYQSYGTQPSNLDGDDELYRMNTLDGSGQKNLSDNSDGDYSPAWGVQAT
jgi:TolB protein